MSLILSWDMLETVFAILFVVALYCYNRRNGRHLQRWALALLEAVQTDDEDEDVERQARRIRRMGIIRLRARLAVRRWSGRQRRVGRVRRVVVDRVGVVDKGYSRRRALDLDAGDVVGSCGRVDGCQNREHHDIKRPVWERPTEGLDRQVVTWLERFEADHGPRSEISVSDRAPRTKPRARHRSRSAILEKSSWEAYRPVYTAADMARATIVMCGEHQSYNVCDDSESDKLEPFPDFERQPCSQQPNTHQHLDSRRQGARSVPPSHSRFTATNGADVGVASAPHHDQINHAYPTIYDLYFALASAADVFVYLDQRGALVFVPDTREGWRNCPHPDIARAECIALWRQLLYNRHLRRTLLASHSVDLASESV